MELPPGDRLVPHRGAGPRATRLIFVSKYLERVADQATNVAEEVIFAIQGRDVRHGNVG